MRGRHNYAPSKSRGIIIAQRAKVVTLPVAETEDDVSRFNVLSIGAVLQDTHEGNGAPTAPANGAPFDPEAPGAFGNLEVTVTAPPNVALDRLTELIDELDTAFSGHAEKIEFHRAEMEMHHTFADALSRQLDILRAARDNVTALSVKQDITGGM